MVPMNTSHTPESKPVAVLISLVLLIAMLTGALLGDTELFKPITAYKTVVETQSQQKLLKIRNDAIAEFEQVKAQQDAKVAVAKSESEIDVIRAQTRAQLDEIENRQRLQAEQVEQETQREWLFNIVLMGLVAAIAISLWLAFTVFLIGLVRRFLARLTPAQIISTPSTSAPSVTTYIYQPLILNLRGIVIRDPELMRAYSQLAREIELRNRQAAITHNIPLP